MVSGGPFWPNQRELSRHLKYIALERIPEFESSHPSQAVRSLWLLARRRITRDGDGSHVRTARVHIARYLARVSARFVSPPVPGGGHPSRAWTVNRNTSKIFFETDT